jgi:hypothetical protein
MTRPIPEEIVTALSGLGALLADWCEQGRDQPLASHEASVLRLVRRVLPRLLEAVVEAATSGLDRRLRRARQACPGCGKKTSPWEAARPRQVLTQCGAITVERPWYHCRACRRGWSAVETVLGVPNRAQTSDGVRQWSLELAASLPYREAAERLDSLTGLALGPETLRRLAIEVGTTIADAEAAEPVDRAPDLLVVETDGTMIRYLDGWHEVKVGLVAGWEDGRLQRPSYVAAREPTEAFGPRLLGEAARRGGLEIARWAGGVTGRGLAILREALILGDGAAWIWKLADDHWTDHIEVVDFYHASEHLAAVAQAAFGDTPDARTWAAHHRHALLAAGPAPVLAALTALTATTPATRETLRRERGYFRQHAERWPTTPSASTACQSARAPSSRPPATSSRSASSVLACAGPSPAHAPSSPSGHANALDVLSPPDTLAYSRESHPGGAGPFHQRRPVVRTRRAASAGRAA